MERSVPTVAMSQWNFSNPFMVKSSGSKAPRTRSFPEDLIGRTPNDPKRASLILHCRLQLKPSSPFFDLRAQNSPQSVLQSRRERKHGGNAIIPTSPVRTKTPDSARASARPSESWRRTAEMRPLSDEARPIVATLPGLSTPLERFHSLKTPTSPSAREPDLLTPLRTTSPTAIQGQKHPPCGSRTSALASRKKRDPTHREAALISYPTDLGQDCSHTGLSPQGPQSRLRSTPPRPALLRKKKLRYQQSEPAVPPREPQPGRPYPCTDPGQSPPGPNAP